MSERQAWRPPVAPKPTNAALRASGIAVRDDSPALRGATAAFNPSSRTHPPAQTASTGAALAAAAAGRARAQPQDKRNGQRTSPSPVRGRSQLSLDLERAARTLEDSAKRQQQELPRFYRTTSEIAARAASANASPSRHPQEHAHHKSSSQNAGSRSRDLSAYASAQGTSESDIDGALLGATLSMSPGPTADTRGPFASSAGKIDFSKIPSLAQGSVRGQSARPPPSSASRSAARTASQGAQRRAHASSLNESPPKVPHMRLKETPPVRAVPEIYSPGEPSSRLAPEAGPVASHAVHNQQREQSSSINDLHASRSSPRTTLPVPIPRQPRTSPRLAPSSPLASPRDANVGLGVSSLANAMVSASLASSRVTSRAPSPSNKKGLPIPRRRSRSLHELEPRRKPENPPLKPMVVRPMRQTLRKSHDDDDEDEKRGRKHRLRKHPNVHHEGDRKRWRDKLTVQERKRYEGLWAANRSVLQEFETFDHRSRNNPPEDLVLNVVVRDIWERSRLPRDVLEEIWDLVADEGDRSLTREQFTVGLWLIDQRLKGRKLPVKVSVSVWASVRHTQGVKISSKPL